MSEPVTQVQFYDAMRSLSSEMQDYHRRQREHIDVQVAHLVDVFEEHKTDDLAVKERVQRIEDATEFKKEEARKSAAVTSGMMAVGITAIWETVRHMVGWK